MSDILDLIDGAVGAWETSNDAMRWTPEPDLRAEANPVHVPVRYLDGEGDRIVAVDRRQLDHGWELIRISGERSRIEFAPVVGNEWIDLSEWISGISVGLELDGFQRHVLNGHIAALPSVSFTLTGTWQGDFTIFDEIRTGYAAHRARMRLLHASYRTKTRNRNRRLRRLRAGGQT